MGQVMLKLRYRQQVHQILGQDWVLRRARGWCLKRCWWPRTCFLTGRLLWGRRAYRGSSNLQGLGPGPEKKLGQEVFWIEKDEFIMWRLKHV